ncbi:MAG TPA: rod shape-determining protein MreD [Flavobacteriales bacterium]|nr:rod shape-determining protein MreD [Flavobacteriales bacterium]
MISTIIKYSFLFVFLILLQVLILNNLHMSVLVNPYVYVLFILLLPFETQGWLVLSLSFVLGMILDTFSNTVGMHTAALVFMAFVRNYLLIVMAPRDGYEQEKTPHYTYMGLIWFVMYAGILIFIHHLTLFVLEDFRAAYFFTAVFKALLSGVFSLVIILILMLFSYRPRR